MSAIVAFQKRAAKRKPSEAAPTRAQSRAMMRRLNRQAAITLATGAAAAVWTALSLSHQAQGIQIMTSTEGWQNWAFAVGMDVTMIVAELAMLFAATPGVRKEVAKWGQPYVIGTLLASAAMNAVAYSDHASGYFGGYPAVVIGVAIPPAIYALTRMGAALYLNGAR